MPDLSLGNEVSIHIQMYFALLECILTTFWCTACKVHLDVDLHLHITH